MSKRVSDEDKQRAQALFAIGKSVREISAELEGRVSPAWISTKAREFGWVRGILPDTLIGPDQPQIYEAADAPAEIRAENTAKLADANRRRWVDQKAEMADKMAEKIQVLLDRAFAPTVVKDVKLRGVGGGAQEPIITKLELDMPSPADQVKLLTGVAILVDKASLLVGDATARVETNGLDKGQAVDRLQHFRDELAARRDKAAGTDKGEAASG